MRSALVSLCLTILLSTPMARRVEAGASFARALVATSYLDHDIEPLDAGDGIDADEEMASRVRGRREFSLDARSFFDPRNTVDTLLSPALPFPLRHPSASAILASRTTWLSTGASQRHAWLQHFLF